MNSHRYWKSDWICSNLIGQLCSGVEVPMVEHPLDIDRLSKIWVELIFVSICHQTNWDLLHSHFMKLAVRDLDVISPRSLRSMNLQRFKETFGPGLDRDRLNASERLHLLKTLAAEIRSWPDDCPRFLENCSVTLSGEHGLYKWLNGLHVFSQDPLHKKTRVFVNQLLRFGLIEVFDIENIQPAIDYHIMRLYVRTGRVFPVSEDKIGPLIEGKTARVEFNNHLRYAVDEAMWYTMAGAGLRMDKLNHIEWQVARSFCVRGSARCHLEPVQEKPVDKCVRDLSLKGGGGCPLAEYCIGLRDEKLRRLKDPRSVRTFY